MSDLLKKDSNGTAQIAYNGEIIAWNTQALQSAADTLKQIASNFESAHEKCKTLVPKINDAWTSTNGSVAYNDKLNNGLVKHFEEGFEAMTALSRILSEVAETYRTCEQKIANEDYSTNYSGGGNTVNQKYTDGGFKTAGKTTGFNGSGTAVDSGIKSFDKSDAFAMAKGGVKSGAKGLSNYGDKKMQKIREKVKGAVMSDNKKVAVKNGDTPMFKSIGFDISNNSQFTQNIKGVLAKQQEDLQKAKLVDYKDIASTIDVSAIKAAEILTKGSIPKEGTLCIAEELDGKPFVIRIKLADGTEHVYPVYIGNSTEMLSAAKTYADSDLEKLEQFKNGTRDLIFNVDSDKTVNLGRATYYDSRNVKLQNGKDYDSVLTTPTLRDMAKNIVNTEDGAKQLTQLASNRLQDNQVINSGFIAQLQNHFTNNGQISQWQGHLTNNGSSSTDQIMHGHSTLTNNDNELTALMHTSHTPITNSGSNVQVLPAGVNASNLVDYFNEQSNMVYKGTDGMSTKSVLSNSASNVDLRTSYFGTKG